MRLHVSHGKYTLMFNCTSMTHPDFYKLLNKCKLVLRDVIMDKGKPLVLAEVENKSDYNKLRAYPVVKHEVFPSVLSAREFQELHKKHTVVFTVKKLPINSQEHAIGRCYDCHIDTFIQKSSLEEVSNGDNSG